MTTPNPAKTMTIATCAITVDKTWAVVNRLLGANNTNFEASRSWYN